MKSKIILKKYTFYCRNMWIVSSSWWQVGKKCLVEARGCLSALSGKSGGQGIGCSRWFKEEIKFKLTEFRALYTKSMSQKPAEKYQFGLTF